MSNKVSAAPEVQYSIVNLASGNATVYASPAQLLGVHIHTVLSAHACPIKDGGASGAEPFSIPASTAAGTWVEGGNMRFGTDMIVVPNGSGTGTITVVYIPDLEGLAGDGA